MSMLLWSSAWDTGISKIDQQHRSLLNQINNLFDATRNQDPTSLPQVLMFLAGYVDAHFHEEEVAMEATNFPGLAEHRGSHNDLRNQVGDLIARFNCDRSALTTEVVQFLIDWLLIHIDGSDREMATYLKQCDLSQLGLSEVRA